MVGSGDLGYGDPVDTQSADLLVIGGGAAGMAAARAGLTGRRRRRVVLVQDGPVGGDCTFTGCVPSKTLLAAAEAHQPFTEALRRVRTTVRRIAETETADILRREGIDVIEGRACFTGPRSVEIAGSSGTRSLNSRAIVIATGSVPLLPEIPGLAGAQVLTNENVFDLVTPPASLLVIGGGPIGCELSQAFARLEVPVTLVESEERLLAKEEPEAGEVIKQALVAAGVDVRLRARVTAVHDGTATLRGGAVVEAAVVLIAAGRRPATDSLHLHAAGIETDEHGWIVANDTLATNVDGIWAAGDITGGLQFTHAADEMGRLAAINATRRPARLRLHADAIPWVTFTDPEVGRVGLTEAQAVSQHPGAKVAYLPLSAVDRAITMGREDGFLQLIAAPRPVIGHLGGGRLVGATIVAPAAGEVIAELALAVRTRMFTGRLAQTVHAYPTIATGVRSVAAQFVVEHNGHRARPARTTKESI